MVRLKATASATTASATYKSVDELPEDRRRQFNTLVEDFDRQSKNFFYE